MNQSQPGKKLNPIIANLTAPIYARDPVRYARLILWVWRQQKLGWPDEAIAKTIELAGDRIDSVDDWWRYLTYLLPKGRAQAVAAESDSHKHGDMVLAMEFVEFLRQRNQRRA